VSVLRIATGMVVRSLGIVEVHGSLVCLPFVGAHVTALESCGVMAGWKGRDLVPHSRAPPLGKSSGCSERIAPRLWTVGKEMLPLGATVW